MAMKEENEAMELDPFDDDDSDLSSDESIDFDSPEKQTFVSRFLCRGQGQSQVKPEPPLQCPRTICVPWNPLTVTFTCSIARIPQSCRLGLKEIPSHRS